MVAGGVVVGGELKRGGMWRVVGAHPLRHGMVHGGMDTTWDRGFTRGGNQNRRASSASGSRRPRPTVGPRIPSQLLGGGANP